MSCYNFYYEFFVTTRKFYYITPNQDKEITKITYVKEFSWLLISDTINK